MIDGRLFAFPSPLNGERFPRTISRIEPLNRVKSSANILPIRGKVFSLSPRERAGVRVSVKLFSSGSFQSFKAFNSERGFMGRLRVRGGNFVSIWQKEQAAERAHPSPSIPLPVEGRGKSSRYVSSIVIRRLLLDFSSSWLVFQGKVKDAEARGDQNM
jgi:hypothetical protein